MAKTNKAGLKVLGVKVVALAVLLCGCLAVAGQAAAEGADEARIVLLQSKARAQSIIESTLGHKQARVRLTGLEASHYAPDVAFKLARRALGDENPAVRFGALVTIGKLKIDRLADAALDLVRDENPSVRAGAIFAAKRCGREVDLSPLGGMLASSDPGVRANAAMLIGQLGDADALVMLREMAALPMPRVSDAERAWVRLQFAEAMARLNPDDAEVLGTVRAAVYSNFNDVRILSIQILGEVGDQTVRDGLSHIIQRDNPIQVKVAAGRALLQMKDRRGLAILLQASGYDEAALRKDLEKYLREVPGQSPDAQALRELLQNERRRARAAAEVRAQAAIALGYTASEAASKRLTELLQDPDEIVQVAAASSVLRATVQP